MAQADFNRLTSQLAASSASLHTAMAVLVASNAQFMRSAADVDANIGLYQSQSCLPSELRATKVIDNKVDQTHRNGLAPRDRDINPLRPDATTQAAIDADPTHALHGVTTFGLEHHEQTPKRIDELNAFHRVRGREIGTLEKQLPHDEYINTKAYSAE
jgi:hypothetical protein